MEQQRSQTPFWGNNTQNDFYQVNIDVDLLNQSEFNYNQESINNGNDSGNKSLIQNYPQEFSAVHDDQNQNQQQQKAQFSAVLDPGDQSNSYGSVVSNPISSRQISSEDYTQQCSQVKVQDVSSFYEIKYNNYEDKTKQKFKFVYKSDESFKKKIQKLQVSKNSASFHSIDNFSSTNKEQDPSLKWIPLNESLQQFDLISKNSFSVIDQLKLEFQRTNNSFSVINQSDFVPVQTSNRDGMELGRSVYNENSSADSFYADVGRINEREQIITEVIQLQNGQQQQSFMFNSNQLKGTLYGKQQKQNESGQNTKSTRNIRIDKSYIEKENKKKQHFINIFVESLNEIQQELVPKQIEQLGEQACKLWKTLLKIVVYVINSSFKDVLFQMLQLPELKYGEQSIQISRYDIMLKPIQKFLTALHKKLTKLQNPFQKVGFQQLMFETNQVFTKQNLRIFPSVIKIFMIKLFAVMDKKCNLKLSVAEKLKGESKNYQLANFFSSVIPQTFFNLFLNQYFGQAINSSSKQKPSSQRQSQNMTVFLIQLLNCLIKFQSISFNFNDNDDDDGLQLFHLTQILESSNNYNQLLNDVVQNVKTFF